MIQLELIEGWQRSPIKFIEDMWGLKPQPLKKKYAGIVGVIPMKDIKPEFFEPFEKGKHLTWQQWLILVAVERALVGAASNRISIASGHGIGKSATLSWVLLWYLFSHLEAQIPCTAPTGDQLFDVLWKEAAKWLAKMPDEFQDVYEWQTSYIRMKEAPATWFARARTARKEAPEALAGIHGDHVAMIVDEASGVPNEVFNVAEGALTGEDVLVMLIGNPTRTVGYFYDTHDKDKERWQTLQFSSIDSPIVDKEYVNNIIVRHGEDSDEYRIRVLGKFPREDAIDEKGYVPLLLHGDIRRSPDDRLLGRRKMGVDPSGSGSDTTVWVVRDNFRSIVVGREAISNPKTVAQKTATLMTQYAIEGSDVFVDNFGVGANVAQELALQGIRIRAVNVGDKADDTETYLNKRAECHWRGREWVRKGGEFVESKHWEELLYLKYRRQESGRLQIMSKREMLTEGIKSPNTADAFILTFYTKDRTRPMDMFKKKLETLNPNQKIQATLH